MSPFFFYTLVWLQLFSATEGYAQNLRNWQKLSSEKIFFPSEGSDYLQQPSTYPKAFSWLFTKVLRWRPEEIGELKTLCPLTLKDMRSISLKRTSPEEVGQLFESCAKPDSWSSYTGFIKLLSVDFAHLGHPFFKPVILHMPEGQKIKGLLGIRNFNQARPLIVLRLGVFGNALDFLGEKYLPLQLFEQGPFNILIVESTSGSDYLQMNRNRWGLAGVDEGLQNFWLAKQLSDPAEPLSKLVSSIHFVGMSLGGQGLFSASELMRHYSLPKVKNFVALCPVIQLEDSLQGLVHRPWGQGFLSDLWVQRRLGSFVEARFDGKFQGRTAWGLMRLRPEFTEELIRILLDTRESPNFQAWDVEPWALSAKQSMDMRADGLKLSRSIPFSVFSAKDDPIVSYAKNTQKLKPLLSKLKNLRIYTLPKGHHCAYPVVYDWPVVGEFMKKLVLGPVALNFRYHEASVASEVIPTEEKQVNIEKIEFSEEAQQWKVLLRGQSSGSTMVVQMRKGDLDFEFTGEDLTEQEKVVGKRWLWQNLEILKDESTNLWKIRWPVYGG